MGKVYTSAVVLIPPEGKWGSIQEIRKKYDRQFNRWMPHITLLYPFWPRNMFPKALDKIKDAPMQISLFTIVLKKIRYFEHHYENFTIWLDPKPSSEIIALQKELLKQFPKCNDVNKFDNGYTPHLSLGQIKGRKNLKDLLFQLQKHWHEIIFEVSEFHLISRAQQKQSRFKIHSTISLKKQNSY
ncbi:MAG: 2'-5' RNA ligase family protein [Promethearchaeota archaeon]